MKFKRKVPYGRYTPRSVFKCRKCGHTGGINRYRKPYKKKFVPKRFYRSKYIKK